MKSDIDAALEKGDEFEKGQNICIISGPKGDELLKKHGANGRFTCDCEACKSHIKAQYALQGKEKVNPVDKLIVKDEDIMDESFTWLMEHLVPPNPDKFKGCELIFPDTAFF